MDISCFGTSYQFQFHLHNFSRDERIAREFFKCFLLITQKLFKIFSQQINSIKIPPSFELVHSSREINFQGFSINWKLIPSRSVWGSKQHINLSIFAFCMQNKCQQASISSIHSCCCIFYQDYYIETSMKLSTLFFPSPRVRKKLFMCEQLLLMS